MGTPCAERYTAGAVIPLYADNPTRRLPVVTVSLIAANLIVFVVQSLLPRWGISPETWYYLLGARPFELTHRIDLPPVGWLPWWAAMVTSLFVHAGWSHLVFNMWYLWLFGGGIEDVMSRSRYLVFFMVCGMIATAAQVLVAPASEAPIVGASGAVAGTLGAYLVLCPRTRVVTVLPLVVVWPVFEMPAWLLLVAWFVLQGIGGVQAYGTAQGGVAFFAHIGGFVAGMLLAPLLAPPGRRRGRRRPVASRRV